jgi:hypothetical protein
MLKILVNCEDTEQQLHKSGDRKRKEGRGPRESQPAAKIIYVYRRQYPR